MDNNTDNDSDSAREREIVHCGREALGQGQPRCSSRQTWVTLQIGAAPRVSPFPELRDAAGLLQRAGFALPVADADAITLSYASPLALLHDLRAAGEANAVRLRDKRTPPRALFPAALAALPRQDGRHPATLRLAMLTGWAPAPSQPKPLARGSGDEAWLAAIAAGLREIRRHGAEALVVSLGMDASRDEPLHFLDITDDGFARAGEAIAATGLPCAIVQEGGYNLDALGRLLRRFLAGFVC